MDANSHVHPCKAEKRTVAHTFVLLSIYGGRFFWLKVSDRIELLPFLSSLVSFYSAPGLEQVYIKDFDENEQNETKQEILRLRHQIQSLFCTNCH